ncbi:hypothetical protein ACFO5R_07530 [Halosolutus amylolyticus]|uniref:Right handed beta helix region n=1 Tax=Halosolutus amylolyticus TaxID=2932267 RepID=A0ABD5PMG7_9EURY|nr:hypothetical protein [Halosolutus amylolyticus]
MAREPSVLNDADADAESADEQGNDGLLHRRSYMKIAGATTAATALAGTAGANDDYEVVEARGQIVRVGSGETYENKLIDFTTGNDFLILVEGGDATIRNVGFEGLYRGSQFVISITAGSGDVLVENVYLGDGATKEGSSFVHGPGAVFMHKNSNADLTFRRCNVQGFPNNGFYCSNTAYGGSVRFENCFGKNNGVSTFRCAGGNDEIVDCVAYNDTTDYGPGYGGFSETSGRPVWVWNGGAVTIRDSHFADGPYPYAMVAGANGSPGRANFESGGYRGTIQRASGSTVSVASGVSRDPDLSIPEGVPTSAEDAASGGSGGTSAVTSDSADADEVRELENVVLIDGDSSDVTRYEFEVDGAVEKSNAEGASIDEEDTVEDGVVQGVVADWKDAFRFSGDLEALTVDGPGTVLVNGDEVDPAEFGPDLPHVLEVEGDGTPASYEITVDGTIELDGEADPDDDVTTVSGSTVQSSIVDETQTFRFAGALTDVTFTDGDADVFLDGEAIDVDEYGEHEFLPHALVIDGTESDGASSYAFEASGSVVRSDYRGASIDDEDVVEGSAVRGVVGDWLDAYWFDGNIEEFTLVGDATVDVQHNARNR